MNVELCKDNLASSKKMRDFQKHKGGPLGPSPGSTTANIHKNKEVTC